MPRFIPTLKITPGRQKILVEQWKAFRRGFAERFLPQQDKDVLIKSQEEHEIEHILSSCRRILQETPEPL